jgi:hypothetical protein
LVPRKTVLLDAGVILMLRFRKKGEEAERAWFACPLYWSKQQQTSEALPLEHVLLESSCAPEALTKMATALVFKKLA